MLKKHIGDFKLNAFLSAQELWIGILLSSFLINVLGLALPFLIIQTYDRVIPNNSLETLTTFFVIGFFALTVEAILKISRGYLMAWLEARFLYKTNVDAFKHILYVNFKDFETKTPSQYLDNINALDTLKDIYSGNTIAIACDSLFVLIYLIILFVIHPYVASTSICMMVVLFSYHFCQFAQFYKFLKAKKQNATTKSKFLIDALSGIHTVKAIGLEEQMLRRYERLQKTSIRFGFASIQKHLNSSRIISIFSQINLILTIVVCSLLYFNGIITVGSMTASILITGKLMQPLSKMLALSYRMAQIKLALEETDSIFTLPPENAAIYQKLDLHQGKIELKKIGFSYKENQPIFHDLSLCIQPGEVVAIHGEGQAGKSTLLTILGGLLMPDSGSFFIDNHDVSRIDHDYLRSQIGFVPQMGTLFQGTIADNICGFDDKYMNRAKEIAAKTGLLQTVENMPKGLQTEVGKGTTDFLSRGDKQLILFTRALIHSPKIILLDEANVAIDRATDSKLIAYLKTLIGKATIVMVSQRPSLLKLATIHYQIYRKALRKIKWSM